MSITVVIPAWGPYAGPCLRTAIASVWAQAVSVEVLVVDNAHPGGLSDLDAPVLRSERRLPLGLARELGLAAVRTPFVMFWDADDVMLDGVLARQLTVLEGDAGVVACASGIVDARTRERHHWPRRWPLALARQPAVFAVLNAVSSLYPLTGSLVRTEVAREVRFPPVDDGDDWVVAASLAFRGRIMVLREPGRLYGRDGASLSAGWDGRARRRHAYLVRQRLRTDRAVRGPQRWLVPLIGASQLLVLHVLRPVARFAPRRRREGM